MSRWENIFALFGATLLLTAGPGRAETAYWSDNFETNAGSRWANNGVWHIGSPAAGPALNTNGFRTHSSTNCASTQNYPYSQDARLVCTNYNGANWLVVPAANRFPRLRFWHWFNFDNALGYVELRIGTNAWQQISPTYENNNGSGVWSRPAIDLSAFAGRSVQLAFHFTSGCCIGNSLGWFVDDVAVVTNAPVLTLPESFEAGIGDWTVDLGTWEAGKPVSGPNAAHTGTNCAGTVLAGNYGNAVDSRLISPPFRVPASGSAALQFWQWYSFNNALGFVEINNGTTSTTGVTNITITTNTVFSSLNTNIYQLVGAANADYATPFYWNPTIGSWTNASKILGNVFDFTRYYFEAGNVSLSFNPANYDYRIAAILPLPQSSTPTNFIAWQGMTWNSLDGNDDPVGYFGTNYSYAYTTNTTVIFSATSWQSLPQTLIKSIGSASATSGGWTNVIIDLRAYAGQTLQLAFHFTSGGIYTATGWYVDDISAVTAPTLIAPAHLTINAGQTLTTKISATNSVESSAAFTFSLPPPSTNVTITAQGVLTWTNTAALPGTYFVSVAATDTNTMLATTNTVAVIVSPPNAPKLTVSQTLAGSRSFAFGFPAGSNTTWRIVASTNLNGANWLPVFTNTVGASGTLQFTDRLATNFLQRFYRAVFP